MSVATYDDLAQHVGHEIEVARYGVDANVSVECMTCSEVLIDFDNEDEA